MNKDYIESVFKSFLAEDGCTDYTDKHFYNCRPLIKKSGENQTEYGFSLSLFGVMALHCQYKGKWADYIDITSHCHKFANVEGIPFSDGDWFHVKIDGFTGDSIFRNIYRYCRNNAASEFDCCSRYMECSNALKCVNPLPARGLLCSYRKKLENGIVFYGDNRNV